MKVLIATDGSRFSRAAVKKCCYLFEGSVNTHVRVVSAAPTVIPGIEPFGLSAGYYADLKKASMVQAENAIDEAVHEIRMHPDLAAGLTSAVLAGDPREAIVREAERWGADVIVLGSHGYGFLQRALLGSISDSVTHHAPCSVLVVRGGDQG